MKQHQKQFGMSYLGVMFILIILAGTIKVIAAVGPAYYDYYTIDKIISSLFREGRTGSINDFKSALSNRFQINNLRDKSPDDFNYSMDGGTLVVELDYEVRSNLTGNLDLVAHFKKTYDSDKASK
ncbi:MAG: DUF4845 domain-containing protein [Gammaproteobacteria bacterium]